MPLRHVLALLLLIVSPLILIGWFGTATLARQQQQQREQLQQLFAGRLRDLSSNLRPIAQRYETELGDQLRKAERDLNRLAELRRSTPIARSVLLVDRDGRLIYPRKPVIDATSETLWYAALSELARGRPIGEQEEALGLNSDSQSSSSIKGVVPQTRIVQFPKAPSSNDLSNSDTRWQSWFHEDGLQLVLWLPRSDQTATGIVLERGRWMADLVEALPATSADESGRYELRDSTDRTVYRWGDSNETNAPIQPLATIRMEAPWNGWRLIYTPSTDASPGWLADGTVPLLATLLALATTLLLLGAYVLTTIRRQMALAQQRVSFASHVSHELRTPLTNIRLYAELAKRDLDSESTSSSDEPNQRRLLERLDVIEEESQRLSRLVTGVLDMVSGKGKLRPTIEAPDQIIRRVVESFAPAFESLEIKTELELNADQAISIDTDVIELVLVNLLSNVEKYAASGKRVTLTSSQTANLITIDVIDEGPGITKSEAKRIFEPFERLDDSLSAPAGTGLGLAIARNAARRHGGELNWIPSESGSHFRFTLLPVNPTSDRVSSPPTEPS
ncbi:sensor histidine kinase [Rhodopirellula baltica]|uniref:histidine kinase n=1 Tax=Rhodopirellula baltica SWK14 TaxID=993516 RepID=L7CKF2_RHOBT|nr:ATP-binding protein [Rhodopirellula baltica]ELP33511.1 membrane protein containing ATP-binding region, ATPase-like protein [Rhodopirellula baltica SWK14]